MTKETRTTSVILDIEKTDWNKLNNTIKIYEFEIPKFWLNELSSLYFPQKEKRLYIRLRNMIQLPYYVNLGENKIYVADPHRNSDNIEIIDDENNVKIPGKRIENFNENKILNNFFKLLTATYFYVKNNKYVSNDSYLLFLDKFGKKENYLSAIKIKPFHHHEVSYNNIHEFFFQSGLTRLKEIEEDDVIKNTPYGLIENQNHYEPYLKQLSFKLLENQKIFIIDTNKKHKVKGDFHSIKNITNHNKTISNKLNLFLDNFIEYCNDLGISLKSKKIELENIKIKHKETLNFKDFEVNIVDIRFKNKNLKSIINILNNTIKESSELNNIRLVSKEPHENDNLLLLMDYNLEDFKEDNIFEKKEDKYKTFKSNFPDTPSQGFCINENYIPKHEFNDEKEYLDYSIIYECNKLNYSDNKTKNFYRNFIISLKQLYLKKLIYNNIDVENLIPFYNETKELIFMSDNVLCYIEDGYLNFIDLSDIDDDKIVIINNLISQKSNFDSLEELVFELKKYNEFIKINNLKNIKLIIGKDILWEIKELKEKILYDDKKIAKVLESREKIKYSGNKFILPEINKMFDLEITKKYNNYVTKNISYKILTYNELKKNHFKDIKEILEIHNEKKFYEALRDCNELDISGKKENGVLRKYQGIWYNERTQEYYVGKEDGYKENQDKSFQLRKIINHTNKFDKDLFFKLLSVDFIRFKETTVIPFQFGLISIYLGCKKKLESIKEKKTN